MWLRGGVVVCALIATVGLNLDVAAGPTKAVQVRSVSVALVGMWVSFRRRPRNFKTQTLYTKRSDSRSLCARYVTYSLVTSVFISSSR